MLKDFRFALRTLRNNAGGSSMAVLILALGIASSVVVLSLLRAFLWRPLEIGNTSGADRVDELVRIYAIQGSAPGSGGAARLRITEGAFFDWRERQPASFTSLVGARNMGMSITDSEQALNPLMREITTGFFEELGATPGSGRRFSADEYVLGGPNVVILDHDFWQSYFAGREDIVGSTIELAYEKYEIVGVMPKGYSNPVFPNQPVLWLPLREPLEKDRTATRIVALGRLAPGADLAGASTELKAISAELGRLYPQSDGRSSVRLLGLRDSLVESIRPSLLALFGAVGFLMLIACTNVASLLLARALGRRREVSVRLAMGARRLHILRQLVVESLLIAGAAGGLGLMLAYWMVVPLPQLAPSNTYIPFLDQVRIDASVIAVTLGLSVVATLIFGLIPSLQVVKNFGSHLTVGEARSSDDKKRRRFRSSLVVAELALSLVLLVGAGLMVRTFQEIRALDLGFEPEGLVTIRTSARGPEYGPQDRINDFYDRAIEKVGAIPGVEAIGACEIMPMFGAFRSSQPVRTAESVVEDERDAVRAVPLRVTPGFFEAFGTPLLQGRTITSQDRVDTPPVTVVSKSVADRLWNQADPIGREMLLDDGSRLRVVGVVADLRGNAQNPNPPPNFYIPLEQNPIPTMSILVRLDSTGDPETFFRASEQAIWSISRDVPVFLNTVLSQLIRDIEWQPRFVMQLLTGFASLALTLACFGLYAVLSIAVAARKREIGVRMSLGARRSDILSLILSNASRMLAVGLVVGGLGAWLLSGLIESQLFGVSSNDPSTYLLVAMVLSGVAMAASAIPALRAARVDPVIALRSE